MGEVRKTEIFGKWIDGLQDIHARARILVRIERLAAGNPGDVKPVGEGASEMRIALWPRLSGLLLEDQAKGGNLVGWRRQKDPIQGLQNRLAAIT